VKNVFCCLLTAQEEAKQIGKINKVKIRKTIEIPSTPAENDMLLNRFIVIDVPNWNPVID
jgi:hypothetical protein